MHVDDAPNPIKSCVSFAVAVAHMPCNVMHRQHLSQPILRCGVLLDDALDLFLICRQILLEQVVRIRLRRRFGIGVVEEILNAQ